MREADTAPKLLLQAYQKYGDKRVAMRKKDYGIWQQFAWKDYYDHVKYLCLGLISLGMERGDHVAIIGDNGPNWYFANLAVQSAGGVVVGIYADSATPEVKYIVEHSDSKFVVTKDQEQVDKMLAIKDDLPLVRKVIYWDDRGLWDYDDTILLTLTEVEEMGKRYEGAHAGIFEQLVEQTKAEDICLLVYTSGTTGVQKGALISHGALITIAKLQEESLGGFFETDSAFSFIPPAFAPEHYYNILPQLIHGFVVYFPEEPETITGNLREIGPRVLLFSYRQWEMTAAAIQARIDASDDLNYFLFNWFLRLGYRVVDAKFAKKRISPFWKFLYKLGNLLVFAPLRDKHGFSNIRACHSSGGVLGPDIIRFFYAIGVPILNFYGATEIGGVGLPRLDDLKLESVGKVPSMMELKITDEGEIICRGPTLFKGYYKDHETTQRMMRDGWFHTGDAGYIDEDGHVYIWDRVKDLSELAGGVKFAPQYVESRLKFCPYINNVMAIGDPGTPYVTAIVNINFDNVSNWAEMYGVAYTTSVDLASKEEVYDLIQEDIERVNTGLPEAARIKKFVLLHKEFDPDEAELTRSRKLRRGFLRERYKEVLDALYSDKEEVEVAAQVKYRDGRTGTVTTKLKIRSVEQVTAN